MTISKQHNAVSRKQASPRTPKLISDRRLETAPQACLQDTLDSNLLNSSMTKAAQGKAEVWARPCLRCERMRGLPAAQQSKPRHLIVGSNSNIFNFSSTGQAQARYLGPWAVPLLSGPTARSWPWFLMSCFRPSSWGPVPSSPQSSVVKPSAQLRLVPL